MKTILFITIALIHFSLLAQSETEMNFVKNDTCFFYQHENDSIRVVKTKNKVIAYYSDGNVKKKRIRRTRFVCWMGKVITINNSWNDKGEKTDKTKMYLNKRKLYGYEQVTLIRIKNGARCRLKKTVIGRAPNFNKRNP